MHSLTCVIGHDFLVELSAQNVLGGVGFLTSKVSLEADLLWLTLVLLFRALSPTAPCFSPANS